MNSTKDSIYQEDHRLNQPSKLTAGTADKDSIHHVRYKGQVNKSVSPSPPKMGEYTGPVDKYGHKVI